MATSLGFGKLPGGQAGAWRCTGPDGADGCDPAGFVAAGAGASRWAGEVVVVGSQITEDRRNCWPGYDLEGSYGPALNEREKSARRNSTHHGADGAHPGSPGKRWTGDARAGTGSRSERTTGSGCAAGWTYPEERTRGDKGKEGGRTRTVGPFISFVEYDRHPFL